MTARSAATSRRTIALALGAALLVGSGCRRAAAPPAEIENERASVRASSEEVAKLELANPSSFERERSPLYLSYYDLGLASPPARLQLESNAEALPLDAVDRDGDGAKDGVFALVDLGPAQTRAFRIVTVPEGVAAPASPARLTQAEISVKQGGKWQPRVKDPSLMEYVGGRFENVRAFTPPPEHTDHSNLIRYEGPGIESDKVGYRVYLDERNGFDIFGKKVPEPVLQGVGLDGYESYHQLATWGMDILKVGSSLGAGAFGFFDGKSIERVSKVSGWDVAISEPGGNLASFRIDYKGWQVAGQRTNVAALFSMTGGSRLVHVKLRLEQPLSNLAIGVVKHPGSELLLGPTDVTDMAYSYLASWGKQSLNDDALGLAVFFRRGALLEQKTTDSDYAAVVEPSGADFDYYFAAAWAGEPGGVQTREAFVHYLEREREQLTLPLRVRLSTARSTQAKSFPSTAVSALAWAKQLADSELGRKTLLYRHGGWDTNRARKPVFEYDIVGLLPMAYDELAKVAPDPAYASVLEKVTGSYVTERGQIETYDESKYSLDLVMPGEALLRLYERTADARYRIAAERLRQQLTRHPRTSEGAFWHKQRYPSQVWLDGVYMGMPFLAHYSRAFERGASLDEVLNEFVVTRARLRDPGTGLYWHAWDERREQSWADPWTGRSQQYWGRGLGWFAMALVDVLDHVPVEDQKHREPLLAMIRELAPALTRVQDEATGTWWQILDQPGAPGNYRESSASAMFSYFFAKAVRKGYLPASYRAVALRSFDGLVAEFVRVLPDGKISLTNQCLVAGLGAGRDGSYGYYMSEPVWQDDPKATGPFILAGVELHRLLGEDVR
jgi:unsaturated rhamnogalacturonyl hydrolase